MTWSTRQQIILAIVPKVSSLFSLFGSVWIMLEVLTDNNNNNNASSSSSSGRSTSMIKRKHPYHRLLLGMSVYDILESVWNFSSTWAIPAGTAGVWQARGTTATCAAQGFFLTLSVAVPMYNAFLSLYYLMVINYGMKDYKIAEYAEPAMHVVTAGWALFTALYSLVAGLYNNANLWCWIAPLPGDCLDSRRYGEEQGNCERGDNAWIYRWAFYFAPLWFCIFFATVCTAMVYWKVQKYDRVTLKYRRPDNSFRMSSTNFYNNNNNSDDSFRPAKSIRTDGEDGVEDEQDDFSKAAARYLSATTSTSTSSSTNQHQQQQQPIEQAEAPRQPSSWWNIRQTFKEWRQRRELFREDHPRTYEVFQQSLWYLGVFYITHVWSTTNRTIQLINHGSTYYGLTVLHSFFDPLQGFLNFLVYQRPRFLRLLKSNPNLTWWHAMAQALTFSCWGGGARLSNRGGGGGTTLSRTTTTTAAARRSQRQATSLRRTPTSSRNSSSSCGGGGGGGVNQDSLEQASGELDGEVPSLEASGDCGPETSLGVIKEEENSSDFKH